MSDTSAVISAKVSPKFKEKFEKLIKKLGYMNTSDAAREALREFMARHQPPQTLMEAKKNEHIADSI